MDLEDNNLTQAVVQDLVADVVAKAIRPVQQAVDLLKKQDKAKAKPKQSSSKPRTNRVRPKIYVGAPTTPAPVTRKGQKQSRNYAQKADESDNASTDGKKTKTNNNEKKNNSKTSSTRSKQG
jgi:NADPH-dependent glutamate synthase beta subunit-like oxidoreductase